MRLPFLLLAATCGLLASCAQPTLPGGYTSADVATLRLRDLNPLAKPPPLVAVRQSTLRAISAERQSFLQRRFAWFRKPVDYNPPALPDGALAFDGALLPTRADGQRAAINIPGTLPEPDLATNAQSAGNGNTFSIE